MKNVIKLYKSPWKALKILALTIPLVMMAIWIITKSDSNSFNIFMGWFALLFFGMGIPLGLFHLLDQRPQIIIDEVGIFDRTTKQKTIKWEVIENAYLTNVHGQKFISLVVNENFKPSNKKGNWYQRFVKLNRKLGFQELNISLGQIKIDEEKLTALIIEMSRAEILKRKEILKDSSFP